MAYQSKLDRIHRFIEKNVLPALEGRDLDVVKVINVICIETGVSESKARECLNRYIDAKIIQKDGSILTIPDEKVDDWYAKLKEREKKEREEEENAKKVLKEMEHHIKENGNDNNNLSR